MASKITRLPASPMTSDHTTPDEEVADMGAFRSVGVQRRQLKVQAGNANLVIVQHNMTKDGTWVSSAVGFKLDGTDSDFAELLSFSRYVRIKAPASGDGSAVFAFDIIGKE